MQVAADASPSPGNRVYTIENATQLTGNGKYQYIILFVAGISSMCMVLEGQAMSFTMPMAKCDLNLSTSAQGFTQSVIFIGMVISSHFWGFITDIWGRIPTLRLTLLLTFVVSAVSSLSLYTWMLIATRLIVGITTAGIKISAIVYMSEFFDNSHRPKYFALFSSMLSMATIVHPLLGMAILTSSFEYDWFDGFVYRPWRVFILCGSLIAGLTGLVGCFLPEGPAYSLAMGRQQEALNTLQTVYHLNSGHPREEYEVKHLEVDSENSSNLKKVSNLKDALSLVWNQTRPLFEAPYRSDMIVLCALMFFAFAISQGLISWYPQILLFFEGRANFSLTTCQTIMLGTKPNSLINATFLAFNGTFKPQPVLEKCNDSFDMSSMTVVMILGAVFVSLNVIAAFSIKAIGKTTVITTWFACNTIASIGLIWANNYLVIMVMMIFALSTISLINGYIAIASDMFETKLKGMATGLLIISGRFGSIVGSNLVAAMIYTSCNLMFQLIAATSIGCTCAIYYILQKTSKVGHPNS